MFVYNFYIKTIFRQNFLNVYMNARKNYIQQVPGFFNYS
jgi:hypothetical protein